MALYLVTMIMRASFYITIAVIQSRRYMGGGLEIWEIGLVMVVYPVAELTTVSFFGSYSDKVGRRPILIASLFLTGVAAYLFAIAPTPLVLLGFSAIFGIAAASKVSTTLSMIADMSGEGNRARLMGYYDLSTLMGLAGGYGFGMILLHFGWHPVTVLVGAEWACIVSGIVALATIRETKSHVHVDLGVMDLIGKVARDPRVQKLVPVYVPIISMYGILITYAEHILENEFVLESTELLLLFGMLGGALVLGIIVMGHLSDHLMLRRPFIAAGLVGFGVLGYLLVAHTEDVSVLWSIWPVVPALAFLAGSFPPAAMAYLTDVSESESRGTTMGVYSVFFGTGMIVGPAMGAFVYQLYGLEGLAVLVAVIIVVALFGTYRMPEVHHTSTVPTDHAGTTVAP